MQAQKKKEINVLTGNIFHTKIRKKYHIKEFYERGGDMTNQQLGKIGEDMAVDLLQAKGYEILQRNYRCRAGEIDIIADYQGRVCFIEVKTRQDFSYGRPCESVTPQKIKHIRAAAAHYIGEMEEQGQLPGPIDFQIIEIVAQHLQHAF